MKKKYIFLVALVATTFAYFEFYEQSALKKPKKSKKKLKIIEFKMPQYNFSKTLKQAPLKEEKPNRRVVVRKKPILVQNTTIVDIPPFQTIVEEPKKIIEPNEPLVKEPEKIVEATVGDDVEGQLSEIKNMRQALLKSEKTPEFLKQSIMALESLRDDYGVDVGFAYRSVVQSDFVSNEISSGGNIDILAMYKPNKSSTYALNLNAAHKAGQYTSGSFANEIGSLYTTSPSYSNKDAVISEFWYQFRDDNIALRVGIVDPSSFVDSSYFMSSNNFFFNSSISSTPYSSVPSNGLGVGFNYKTDSFYISSQLSDADAKSGESLSNLADRIANSAISLYSSVEFGLLNKESFYYVNLWHKEQEKNAQGIIFSLNQTLDSTNKIFAKVALSKEASAKEYVSLGWGRNNLLSKEDKVGVAYSATKSKNNNKIQNNLEMFYRYDYLYGIQLSANIEFLNPIYSKEDLAVLGGLRLRLVF